MNREHYLSKRVQSPPEADQQVEPESKKARAAQALSSVSPVEKPPAKKKPAGSETPDKQINR